MAGRPKSTTETISAMEAVRQTLAAGIEDRTLGVQHIRDKWNLVISPDQFSANKSQIRNKAKGAAKAGRKRNGTRGRGLAGRSNGSSTSGHSFPAFSNPAAAKKMAEHVREACKLGPSHMVIAQAEVFGVPVPMSA